MKLFNPLCFVFLVSQLLFTSVDITMAAPPQSPEWKEVQQAIQKGLPKTAIEKLQPIIDRAKQQENFDEAIRAIATKISLEGNIQGNKAEEKINRMRDEIAAAPKPMQPVMESILANWYWHFFQQNRWRFMQRTQSNQPASDDMLTWDLARILSETSKQFEKALTEAEQLKTVSVETYDALLDKGNAPDAYRPTLWDFLVYDALDFYTTAEQAGAKEQDSFELRADSPVFSSITDFISWKPTTGDADSPTLAAVKLFQQLLRFHQDDEDPSALLDADLARLTFANNKSLGEEKAARFKAGLKRFGDQNAEHRISARALHALAEQLHQEGDYIQAKEIATKGLAAHEGSIGARRCFNLIQSIEQPWQSTTTERVWNDPRPTIDVRYKNIEKIYFRLIPFDFDEYVNSERWQPIQFDQQNIKTFLERTPTKHWSADLPKTDDYKEQTQRLPSPKQIPAGSYFLFSSHREDFSDTDNKISVAEVWVSELAFVTRTIEYEGVIEGFVLDANTGQPVPSASVRSWTREGRNRRPFPSVQTDVNGYFRLRPNQTNHLLLLAEKGVQRLSSENVVAVHRGRLRERVNEQTQFFTDRALYRPGQTIRYKGICIQVNQQKNDYSTIPNRNLFAVFLDVNGKEIERVQHRTNDYGSFSGSMTAPRDRLMGRMTIRVEGGPSGQTSINVEEYKRPKFRVDLSPPKQAASLGEKVTVAGNASSYTGAPIDDAFVTYRVVREVRYPKWYSWRARRFWWPERISGNQEIANGTIKTDSDGNFEIQFDSKPDRSVPRDSEPTFQFVVYADVTDSTGETRSDRQTINVGYTSLSANLSADKWITNEKAVEIRVETTTLDGEGQKAHGKISVFSLKQPRNVIRPSLSGGHHPDPFGAQGDPFGDVFGRDDQDDSPNSNPQTWETDQVIKEFEFTTDQSGKTTVEVELDEGVYRAKLDTRDAGGNLVTSELQIHVLDPDGETLNVKVPELLIEKNVTVEPGESMQVLWGTGYPSARAYFEIEHRGKTLKRYWTRSDQTQTMIEFPVTESMRGGFTLRTTMVRENRLYVNNKSIDVPWSNKQLNIRWEHFVSKLKPAAEETWTAIIEGPNAERAAAEMVATLYDASLDAFKDHHWLNRFNVFYQDRSRVRTGFENSVQTLRDVIHGWHRPNKDTSWSYRRYPNEIIQYFRGFGFQDGVDEQGWAWQCRWPLRR